MVSSFRSFLRELRHPSKKFESFFYEIGKPFGFNRVSNSEAINQGFLSNSEFFSIVDKIAKDCSAVPIQVLRNDEEIEEGELYQAINFPNLEQSRQQLWYEIFVYLLSTGDSFIWREKESLGFVSTSMKTLPCQNVEVVKSKEDSILAKVEKYKFEYGQERVDILPEEMIHLRYFDPSSIGRALNDGLSPMQAGAAVLLASNNLQIAEASIFENRGTSAIISAGKAEIPMMPKDQKNIDKGLNNRMGGAHRANSVITTSGDIKVHQLGMSSSDMKLLESKMEHLRQICRLFGTPSILYGDPKASTYNNMKEAMKAHYSGAVLPNVELLLSTLNRTLVREINERSTATFSLKINKKEIEALNPSQEEIHNQIRQDVEKRILTPNEAREMIYNLEEIEGGEQLNPLKTSNSNIDGN
jgi:HK97 family phage portal protein